MSREVRRRGSVKQRLEQRKGGECQTEEDAEEHQGAMFQPLAAAGLYPFEQPVRSQVQHDSSEGEVDR